MVLDVGTNIFDKTIFKISPEDGDSLFFYGNRKVPKSTKKEFEVTKSAETIVDDATVGTVAWTNPTNAGADNGTYAGVSLDGEVSHYLKATKFNFNIPEDAVINGIYVEMLRHETQNVDAGADGDYIVKIVKSDDTLGTENKAVHGVWGLTPTIKSFGSKTDLWSETWTAADINNDNFGIVIAVNENNISSYYIDVIKLTIYYIT